MNLNLSLYSNKPVLEYSVAVYDYCNNLVYSGVFMTNRIRICNLPYSSVYKVSATCTTTDNSTLVRTFCVNNYYCNNCISWYVPFCFSSVTPLQTVTLRDSVYSMPVQNGVITISNLL